MCKLYSEVWNLKNVNNFKQKFCLLCLLYTIKCVAANMYLKVALSVAIVSICGLLIASDALNNFVFKAYFVTLKLLT